MANVQDVAAFFIDFAQKQWENGLGDLATNMRVQKLLYFAQGWHLARHGKTLFDAPIEAWQYGPLVPEVYNRYSAFGGQGIVCASEPDYSAFTHDEFALLLDIASEYDSMSTSALVNLSHERGAPWSQTPRKEAISVQMMQEYFSSQPQLLSTDDILRSCSIETVTPTRSERGVAVFPAGFDDDWGEYDAD